MGRNFKAGRSKGRWAQVALIALTALVSPALAPTPLEDALAPAGAITTHFYRGPFCEAGTGPGEAEACKPSFPETPPVAAGGRPDRDGAFDGGGPADRRSERRSALPLPLRRDGVGIPAAGHQQDLAAAGIQRSAPIYNQVAIDNSGTATDGDIYITQYKQDKVEVFSREGAHLGDLSGAGATPFGSEVCGVAVDGAGDVYVADSYPASKIYKYTPGANPPVNGDVSESFDNATYPCQLAIGAGPTAGYLFYVEALDTGGGKVKKLDIEGLGKGEVKYTVDSANNNVNVAVDPTTGHIYTVHGQLLSEYDASGTSEATPVAPSGPAGSAITPPPWNAHTGSGANGVAIEGASGTVYAGGSSADISVFGPTVKVPGVRTDPADELGGTEATLHGLLNPDGLALEGCFFEYGMDTEYGQMAECEPTSLPEDSSDHAVSAHLEGLTAGATYHFRLVAPGEEGSLPGSDEEFETLNPVQIGEAAEVKDTTATLNGEVNPYGVELEECAFEYGASTAYGEEAACSEYEFPVGSGEWHELNDLSELGAGKEELIPVRSKATDLLPNGTEYHFRLAAKNPVFGAARSEEGEPFKTAITVVTEPPSEVKATSATLSGKLNPYEKPFSQCRFEYGTTTAYGQTVPCAEGAWEGAGGESLIAVQADLTGLDPGTPYHYRLAASNGAGAAHGADEPFQTPGPLIAATWSQDVSFGEATLKAQIDPEGDPTTYVFQYGTAGPCSAHPCASAPIPDGDVGDDSNVHTVSERLEGLSPGTTYHYRVLARSECEASVQCTDAGPDLSFETYLPLAHAPCANDAYRSGPSAALPDCRAYEMVSPVDKGGGDIVAPRQGTEGFYEAATDGNRLTYTSTTAFGDAVSAPLSKQYLATRGSTGWLSHALNQPQGTTVFDPEFALAFDLFNHFQAFTPDLCHSLLVDDNLTPLTPDAIHGYTNAYLRENCGGGAGGYEAVTVGGAPSSTSRGKALGVQARAYSQDLDQVFFTAYAALTPDAAPVTDDRSQVYEHPAGAAHDILVSKLPDGEASTLNNALGFAGQNFAQTNKGTSPDPAIEGTVSTDGSRAFWTASGGGPEGHAGSLYLRLNPSSLESAAKDGDGNCVPEAGRACTIEVSGDRGPARFRGADPAGSRALFTTADGGLYLFDTEKAIAGEAGAVTEIAGGVIDVPGFSSDLSRIYFTSTEARAGAAVEGKPNLYLYEGAGLRFIATLGTGESPGGRATPDGSRLAFTSTRPLTGYDNADAASGEADRQLFLYDATADGGAGRLRCVSCNPSGARPQGASQLPPREWSNNARRPLVSGGRRLFFESDDALVPGDTDGKDGCPDPIGQQPPSCRDVYQWEAPGTGSCSEGDPDYFPRNGGCIDLISTGKQRLGLDLHRRLGERRGRLHPHLLLDRPARPRPDRRL